MNDDQARIDRRIDDIRRKQAEHLEHERRRLDPASCTHDSGTMLIGKRLSNGVIRYYDACDTCQREIRPSKQHGTDDTPIVDDLRYLNPPCAVCGALGTEIHHWAPRAVFGPVEADIWPTSYLCPDCHTEWHRRMGPIT